MINFPNAKINIGLNVTQRRMDGYHNLESVFYPVRINDALEVLESKELNFTSSGLAIPGNSADNLCVKAYYLIKQDFNIPPVHIHLHKHIPIGAGLGGGSADAAFLIQLMNEKFELGLSAEQMEDYARQLGADCAFFIQNKPVFAFEKGDQFKTIFLDLKSYFLVLAMPKITVTTAEAYSGIKPGKPDHSLIDVIRLSPDEWKKYIKNDFEEFVFEKYPSIGGLKEAFYESGAIYASMSGSGSSVYGIFRQPVSLPKLEKECKVFYNI